jgi:DNA-binding LytR/AlgR family response regulator
VCDPIFRQPVGVIDISVWRRPMPAAAVAWPGNAVRGIEGRLARRAYAELSHRKGSRPAPALTAPPETEPLDDRIIGMHGERLMLVPLEQVRYVEISNGTLWLDTDLGRLRTPGRTLDGLERRLGGQRFMRANRSALVNLSRIRELAPSFKDGLWVLVDGSETLIPVSRRRAAWLRAKLGL